jgi:hypothetical protein
MDAGKDPYFINYFRINFDGTGLVRYTQADGTHTLISATGQWAADQQFYVDSYSASTSDRDRVASRERRLCRAAARKSRCDRSARDRLAHAGNLRGEGPGQYDRHLGHHHQPTNFDPAKKYPVIENIYAGPQGSFVPKGWSTQAGMMSLAELGFIVVQVDGMGTANRSKAFHDVAFQNIGDAGFPDRILWHKAIAAKYSVLRHHRASGSTAHQRGTEFHRRAVVSS